MKNKAEEEKKLLEEERARLGIQAPSGQEPEMDESQMNVDQKFLAKKAHLRKCLGI